jgi:hypothetical protein
MRCAYCFAEDHMQTAIGDHAQTFITLDTFEARLDALDRSGIDEIRLIGGEPTLHPQFPALIERARRRGKHLVVFTHGLISERALAVLEAIPVDACTILVNTNASRHIDGPTPDEQARRRAVLLRLGARALPGFTIDTPGAALDFLLSLALETGCQPKIRLGLAQPILSGRNRYLHPKQYPLVGQPIARFAQAAAQYGITVELDCGFVRCMFSETELEMLHAAGVETAWRCSPILDVGIDGTIMHCFSLGSRVVLRPTDSATATDLRAALADQVRPYRAAGIYKACSSCSFKLTGACTGGCLSATLQRFRASPAPRLVVPEEVLGI